MEWRTYWSEKASHALAPDEPRFQDTVDETRFEKTVEKRVVLIVVTKVGGILLFAVRAADKRFARVVMTGLAGLYRPTVGKCAMRKGETVRPPLNEQKNEERRGQKAAKYLIGPM